MEKAKQMYELIKQTLVELEWTFNEHEEDLVIQCGVLGDDLPMDFIMAVRHQNNLLSFISTLPLVMPEERRIDGAIAACVINEKIINGCFGYDINDGTITFTLNNSYAGSEVGSEVVKYMIIVSLSTIDNYNGDLVALANGEISIEELIAKIS